MIAPLILAKTLDGCGVYGSLIHYSFAFFFGGSALLIFAYLWKKGLLDMDEEPAIHMLKEESNPHPSHANHNEEKK